MTNTVLTLPFHELPAIYEIHRTSLEKPVPFMLPSFLQTWWNVYGTGEEPLVHVVRDGDDIAGIAPLRREGDTVSFVGNADVCDYQDFFVVPGKEEVFFTTLISHLKSGNVCRLDLGHVRPDSAVLRILVPMCQSAGCRASAIQEAVSVEMVVPADFETYISSLDGKQRHECRRKLRRFSKAGKTEYVVSAIAAEIDEAMNDFLRMFVDSREDKAEFLNDKNKRFFDDLSVSLTREGIFRIGSLKLDDKPVAAVIFFDLHGRRYLYNSGYDPDYTMLSAGLVSKLLTIKDAIEEGLTSFDFLKGNEPYKNQLGGVNVPLSRCTIDLMPE